MLRFLSALSMIRRFSYNRDSTAAATRGCQLAALCCCSRLLQRVAAAAAWPPAACCVSPQGAPGSKGPRGERGEAGAPVSFSDQRSSPLQDAPLVTCFMLLSVPQGSAGPPGNIGSPGPMGLPGPQGPSGMSIPGEAVSPTHTPGTHLDFLSDFNIHQFPVKPKRKKILYCDHKPLGRF